MSLVKKVNSGVLEKLLLAQPNEAMQCNCGNDYEQVCSGCSRARIAEVARRKGLDPNRYVKLATTTVNSERQRKQRIRNMQYMLTLVLGRKPSRKEIIDMIELEGRKIYEREQAEKNKVVNSPDREAELEHNKEI